MQRRKWLWVTGAVVVIGLVMGFVWASIGDLPGTLEPRHWIRWGIRFAHQSQWAPFVFVVLIALMNQLLVPINLLLLAAALAFPGWAGFTIGMGGAVLAALMQAELGRWIGKETLQSRFGEKFEIVSSEVAANGLAAMVVMSIVPIAPNLATNMVAGVCRVPRWKLILGTIVGFLPGLVILNLLSREMRVFASDPSLKAGIWIVGVIGLLALIITIARRSKARFEARLRSMREARMDAAPVSSAVAPGAS